MPDRVLLFGVPALMLALFGVDKYLARLELTELEQEAQGLYQEGSSLLKEGRSRDAVDRLRRAHSMVRTDSTYSLALAEAALRSGQAALARPILEELLQADSNNAKANLLTARLSVAESNFAAAEPNYHRAIYGRWPQNEQSLRLETRFELARMLALHGTPQELLSELLLLQASAPDTSAMQQELGRLFLKSGSGPRAAGIFRALIRANPSDAQAYAGLGQAESLSGNYRAAELAFANAVYLEPGDKEIKVRAESAKRLSSLDPTPRRLTSQEKFSRSIEILRLTEQAFRACYPAGAAPAPMLDLSHRLLADRSSAATNERAEARLDAAEALWRARPQDCPAGDATLTLIMQKLAQ